MSDQRILLVGGVGGSGTRIVAQLVNEMGVFIGSNLNKSLDNLDWPSDGKIVRDESLSSEEKRSQLELLFRPFIKEMQRKASLSKQENAICATKVPGSFYYLPYLSTLFDTLHYIHVIRHGLDMAFSKNLNQLYNWGKFFDICPVENDIPRYQLRYWVKANEYALQQCEQYLPGRFLVLRFEDVCRQKEASIRRIGDFLGLSCSDQRIGEIKKTIGIPDSIDRHKTLGEGSMFDQDDLKQLETFGYQPGW